MKTVLLTVVALMLSVTAFADYGYQFTSCGHSVAVSFSTDKHSLKVDGRAYPVISGSNSMSRATLAKTHYVALDNGRQFVIDNSRQSPIFLQLWNKAEYMHLLDQTSSESSRQAQKVEDGRVVFVESSEDEAGVVYLFTYVEYSTTNAWVWTTDSRSSSIPKALHDIIASFKKQESEGR